MAYLGIDFGTKRIGVAFSSEDDSMAFPLKIVAMGKGGTGEDAVKEICTLARERGVHKIIMGESNDFDGQPNKVMKDIEAFAEALRTEGFEIIFEPEFMTSEASLRQGQDKRGQMQEAAEKHLDASAAALILQSYLDRKINKE